MFSSEIAHYIDEPIVGYSQGDRVDNSITQLTLWPPRLEDIVGVPYISPENWLKVGRLYLMAESVYGGARHFAETAVNRVILTISDAFYGPLSTNADFTDPAKTQAQRLVRAVWAGHKALGSWRATGYCRQHGYYQFNDLPTMNQTLYTCPVCEQPFLKPRVSIAAASCHAGNIILLGIGDMAALYLHHTLGAPGEPLTFPANRYLGLSNLDDQELKPYHLQPNSGDQLILLNRAAMRTISYGKPQNIWHTELRRQFSVPSTRLAPTITHFIQALWQQKEQTQAVAAQRGFAVLVLRKPSPNALGKTRLALNEAQNNQERQRYLENILPYERNIPLWREYQALTSRRPIKYDRTEPAVAIDELPERELTPTKSEWSLPAEAIVSQKLNQMANKIFKQKAYAEGLTILLSILPKYPNLYINQASWQALYDKQTYVSVSLLIAERWQLLEDSEQAEWLPLAELQVMLAHASNISEAIEQAQQLHPPSQIEALLQPVLNMLEDARPLLNSPFCHVDWQTAWHEGYTVCQAATAWQLGDWHNALSSLNQVSVEPWLSLCQAYVTAFKHYLTNTEPKQVREDGRIPQLIPLIREQWYQTSEDAHLFSLLIHVLASPSSLVAMSTFLTKPSLNNILPTYRDYFQTNAWQEIERGLSNAGDLPLPVAKLQAAYTHPPITAVSKSDQALWALFHRFLTFWQAQAKEDGLTAVTNIHLISTSPLLPPSLQPICDRYYEQYIELAYNQAITIAKSPRQMATPQLKTIVNELTQHQILPPLSNLLHGLLADRQDKADKEDYFFEALLYLPQTHYQSLQSILRQQYGFPRGRLFQANWHRRRSNP